MSKKTHISFSAKIVALLLLSSVGLAAVTGAIALKKYHESYRNFLASYRKSLYSDFDSQAKSEVETAVAMLQRLSDRSRNGEMTLEEAKLQGADLLRSMRYGKEGYFWADTTEGINVVLLGTPVEGKSRIDKRDAKGKYNIRAIIKAGMQPGGGFSDYYTTKKGSTITLPKRSYSLLFQPFNWVIGTGNYVDDLDALVAKAAEENRRHFMTGIYTIVSVVVALAVIISFASVLLLRNLLRSLGGEPEHLAHVSGRVASGDLTVHLESGKEGVYESMRQMVENLRQIIERVSSNARAVAGSAVELQATAEKSAGSLQHVVGQATTVATASEEMSATSSDIAHNCHMAAESSNRASSTAQRGAAIVENTLSGMNRIAEKVRQTAVVVDKLGDRSEQIGEIVSTIEDIADQTNLLALNAAIEAARAGEQGRGFAVVADEVRALAERTTRATREISEMIKAIQAETRQAVTGMEEGVGEVERGTTEAASSGEALREILAQIDLVTQQINQIATASEEQTATTREISGNIQNISDTIHVLAQSSREVSQASSHLSDLSVELQDVVAAFQV
ncbi:methyl-accepting chemotaxis protein [Geomesophilobacter sediminis]|uniref:Cache domain-containing protein n=1 Tax=Geomesophilobacter sediminis TaxID=2798584 RepID=A0A8J7LUM6_9BACT|nr:methyl-accepting chemotaxis protein [Geomesophilobacter sediminis]MBJ6723910.1 cache domain-containing protein [Geomesophilobacter sediminis]